MNAICQRWGAGAAGVLFVLLAVLASAGASAAPVGSDGVRGAVAPDAAMQKVYYGGYCARLSRACNLPHGPGEPGEVNCRRYRTECVGGRNHCANLRRDCEHRKERGETGDASCRRYHKDCDQ